MKIQNLNDGFVNVYRTKEKKNDFNAPVNAKTEEDMDYIVELAYEEMSKRDQDYQFAESVGRKLSLKIKTKLFEIDKSMKVIMEGTMYAIIKTDTDKKKELLYLYLEEERTIAK